MEVSVATDEALIQSLRSGDKTAGGELFRRFESSVAAVCWAVSGDRQIAEEAAQETWLRMVKGLSGYREGGPVRPWVLTIARNTTRDLLRRRARDSAERAVEPEETARPESALLRRECAEQIARAIAELAPPHREVITLKYAMDLPNEEIAAVLGIRRSALWMRLSRARQELRRRVDADLCRDR